MTTKATPASNAPLVLVVEDERDLADLYATWLAEEYRVRTAYTGEQALEEVDDAVDVVLLDRRLPSLSGDEVLAGIRARGHDCRVAMVTAVEPDFDILSLDVDEYLTKPLDADDLCSAVERLVLRGSFETHLQSYLSLAAKKTALEENKTASELRNHTEYTVLSEELAEMREGFNDRLADVASGDDDSLLRYPVGRVALDGALIASVAAVLIAIHVALPNADRRLVAFGPPGENLLISFISTYVHAGTNHLLANAAGYLTAAFATYLLILRLRAARWFYLTAPLLVTVLPLGTAALSRALFALAVPDIEPVFLGFSDVVAGFIGFSFLAFMVRCRTAYDYRTVFFVGTFVALVSVDALFWIHRSALLVPLVGVTTLVLAALLVSIVGSSPAWTTTVNRLSTVTVATALYATFTVGFLPTMRLANPLRIGIAGHAAGFVGGFAIALITASIANVFPIREQLRRQGYPIPDR